MKKSLLLTLSLVFSVTAAHAASPTEYRPFIVGGQEVQADDPITKSIVVILGQSGQGEFLCTGSIIAPNVIITAAHCASDENTGAAMSASALTVSYGLKVSFGQTSTQMDAAVAAGLSSRVKAVRVYDGWPTQMNNPVDMGDVAILQIEGKVPNGYTPVPLLTDDSQLKAGGTVTLAGYGISDAGGSGAGTLRKVDGIKILNPTLGKTELVLDQSQGHGACHGDSGGPGYLVGSSGQLTLWGLTDRGYPDNAPDDCAHQSVYTKVDAYTQWISNAVQTLSN